MKWKVIIGLFIFIIICSSGCTSSSSSQGGTQGSTGTKATGTTAAPAGYGAIEVISDPWGGSVYLDDTYQGTAPMTIQEVPEGKHILVITKTGYKISNTTVTVTADKTTSVKKTLSVGKPDIYLTINSTKYIYQGNDPLFEFIGKLYNKGEKTAYNMVLIIEMTPKDAADKDYKATKEIKIGHFYPGDDRSIVQHIQLRRGIDYKGTIKYEYEDDNSKTVKGTAKTF